MRHPPPFGPGPRSGGLHAYGFRPGLLLMLLIAGLLIAIVVMLARRPRSLAVGQIGGGTAAVAPVRMDAAVEEVRMRYARGEINEEEFRRLMADLGAGGAAAT